MRVLRCLFICIMLFTAGLSRLDSATVYTDQTSFLNAVQPGYYLESFDSLMQPFVPPPLLFSSNGFSYTADTQDDLFFTIGGALSTDHDAFDITFDLTSNNVTAIGASFFLGASFVTPGALLNVSLDDGTTFTLNDPIGRTFIGFTSTTPIQSLTVSTPTQGRFAGVDDLITGSAVVPEPGCFALCIVGMALVYFSGRRRS